MKNKTQNKQGSKISSGNNGKLDQVAGQLDELARLKLRDGRLDGILRGHEADIRQESILLALDWYVRGQPQDSIGGGAAEWNAPKGIAAAMKFIRRRFVDVLKKQPANSSVSITEFDLGSVMHPSDIPAHEWPAHQAREMVRKGISKALKNGHISHSNATVARMVICDAEGTKVVAQRLKCHRSNVNQHVSKVRDALGPMMDDIEVPFHG
ncbi:MAG: hypothetical protein RLZZ398_202 [Verrucomicrobiota bacterium]|jgi:hypothetical protein